MGNNLCFETNVLKHVYRYTCDTLLIKVLCKRVHIPFTCIILIKYRIESHFTEVKHVSNPFFFFSYFNIFKAHFIGNIHVT